MASSFRRRKDGGEALNLPGTKPWTGGITLTSTGLRDLDQILGSGQALGTCIWLEEDRWTHSLATCLVQYWCAEAMSQEQILLIPSFEKAPTEKETKSTSWEDEGFVREAMTMKASNHDDTVRLLNTLPRNLHFDKVQQSAGVGVALHAAAEQARHLDTLCEEDEGDAENDEGLKIAWQYRKSVQQERSGQPAGGSKASNSKTKKIKEFCHSYDLQGSLIDQIPVLDNITTLEYSCECNPNGTCSRCCGFQFFETMRLKIESILAERRQVIRILLYKTPSLSALAIALPLLISYIRKQQLPVVLMVACQPWTYNNSDSGSQEQHLSGLRRISDVVLEAEGFASRREYPQPSEFRMFQGLLQIRKVTTLTAATAVGHFADRTNTRQPAADLYGLKRDRRKLNIQMLHIPPEDYAEVGGSGNASSGGLGCASSGGALSF